MAAMALRQEVIDYMEQLDDERAELVLVFAKTLSETPKELKNSKTPEQVKEAVEAFAWLENMNLKVKDDDKDDRSVLAERLWRKYESLS